MEEDTPRMNHFGQNQPEMHALKMHREAATPPENLIQGL